MRKVEEYKQNAKQCRALEWEKVAALRGCDLEEPDDEK
jgi:hypothetical protein